jgi:hypothetical protein
MSAVLPHYKPGGPANFQVNTLIYGGQWVTPHVITAGTTDFTVIPSVGGTSTAGDNNVLGVAGKDGNVITTQTGAANSYGEPLIDISVLDDYISVYYGFVDIWCWYAGPAGPGELLTIGAATTGANCNGTVCGVTSTGTIKNTAGSTIAPAYNNIVGKCTYPGGVTAGMLTQQIGGQGTAAYFLGRARVMV